MFPSVIVEGPKAVSVGAGQFTPRPFYLDITLENPASPPCYAAAQAGQAGRLTEIRQEGLERALYFTFECLNELGTECC